MKCYAAIWDPLCKQINAGVRRDHSILLPQTWAWLAILQTFYFFIFCKFRGPIGIWSVMLQRRYHCDCVTFLQQNLALYPYCFISTLYCFISTSSIVHILFVSAAKPPVYSPCKLMDFELEMVSKKYINFKYNVRVLGIVLGRKSYPTGLYSECPNKEGFIGKSINVI